MRFTNDRFQLAATDLSNHLSCEHLTQLNRKVAMGQLKKSSYYDPALDLLIQRGREHEAAYVEFLKAKDLLVVNVNGKSMDAVVSAMAGGADVIVQANLEESPWHGYADILLKVPGKSNFGNWSYEVQDTKLSQNTRAGTILQLCLYTELLAKLQGTVPEQMWVVKPGIDFPAESYAFSDFQAYYRFIKNRFESVIANGEVGSYPYPVEQCNICNWWQICDKKRHDDDHLSLVAGIRAMHVSELERQGIKTLEQFATTQELLKPERGNAETFVRKKEQAFIQLEGRIVNKFVHKLLKIEPGRGLNRLPEPDQGDIYFDIEGDAFFPGGSLEYLLGYAYKQNGRISYHGLWAANRVDEKNAFVHFMTFVNKQWAKFPNMYIYHFAPYEPSALRRLARVHAVFEKEVDDLLRAERFVDLHAVFKESMLASVETYSLKALEKVTAYTRNIDLHDASAARKVVEIALELGTLNAVPQQKIDQVTGYNEDDCLATEALHQWLEGIRKIVAATSPLTRPPVKFGDASENIQNFNARAQALFNSLTRNLPDDRDKWNDEHRAKWLLAHQIEYFRREDKSAWWEYFRVHELEHEDLLDERKAVTGLKFVSVLPKFKGEKNTTHRYTFPPQEISIDEGDDVIEVKGEKIGTVRAISLKDYTIDIKKTAKAIDVHPSAVHVSERIDPGTLATSLMDIAAAIDEDGLDREWGYHAAKDLLMKRSPQLSNNQSGAYVLSGEDDVKAAIRIAIQLDKSVFAIQGPPGAGKTFTGANMIIALTKAGKKIGITGVSHKVIRNLAKSTVALAKELNEHVTFMHKVKEKSEAPDINIAETEDADDVRAALNAGAVGCGTAWLWAEDKSRGVLDYLFVDEAGQMSLSQVLAASRAAKNLILLGDPQQLEQPQRGAHPEGSDVAGLTHFLDGASTMPEGKGLFLGVTRRLHPEICAFTSELFYDGRLRSFSGLERQRLDGPSLFNGAGLFYVPTVHRGNQNKSREEVAVIRRIVDELVGKQWTNSKGETIALTRNEILIIAPYNAQVSALLEEIPDVHIGTVDKFQGQEAPVVIYSMTASTVEDAPKGMSFLFNPNRLNVATSRAKGLCIIVASPKLFEADCRTIDQIRWANTLCRYREMAKQVSLE